MKRQQSLTTALLLLMSTSSLTQAQNRSRTGTQRPSLINLVRVFDRDADGAISAAELEKAPEALLALDQDDSGTLSVEELGFQSPRRGGGRSSSAPSRERRSRGERGGGGGPRPTELGAAPGDLGDPGIAWYGRLDLGLAEAKRSNRPILFMAAASQCGGVPGVF